MLKCLSANWYGTSYNEPYQEYIHNYADKLRNYDDNSFNRAILLNRSDGASGAGHNAIMLLNNDNEGLVFSFYATKSDFPDMMLTDAEMRFAVLSSDEVNEMLYEENPVTIFLVASDNNVVQESYDRFAYYDLPSGGYNMYHAAINLYDDPGTYALLARQCDDIACEILKQGGIKISSKYKPNKTYEDTNAPKWTTYDN